MEAICHQRRIQVKTCGIRYGARMSRRKHYESLHLSQLEYCKASTIPVKWRGGAPEFQDRGKGKAIYIV